MSQQQSTTEQVKNLPDKIRFPTQRITRDKFYKTTENVRYYVKFSLVKGVAAKDCPLGMEDLMEYLSDVEQEIDQWETISVDLSYFEANKAFLQTQESYLSQVEWRNLEETVEEIAESHCIALHKSISMSGRGYDDEGMRSVMVTYTFGSATDESEWISDQYIATGNDKWVGGEFGSPENLTEVDLTVTSVDEPDQKSSTSIQKVQELPNRIKNFFTSLKTS